MSCLDHYWGLLGFSYYDKVKSLKPRKQCAEEECVAVTIPTVRPKVWKQHILRPVHDVLQRTVVHYDVILLRTSIGLLIFADTENAIEVQHDIQPFLVRPGPQ